MPRVGLAATPLIQTPVGIEVVVVVAMHMGDGLLNLTGCAKRVRATTLLNATSAFDAVPSERIAANL